MINQTPTQMSFNIKSTEQSFGVDNPSGRRKIWELCDQHGCLTDGFVDREKLEDLDIQALVEIHNIISRIQ